MRRCLPRFFRFNFEMYEEITFGFSFLLTNLPTFFFFNDPATTKISTLPLHDALPIYFGELGVKTSSAQFTQYYDKTDLVGKLVLAVVNFPPRQIANFFSEVLTLEEVRDLARREV